jgi:hypothetical protein
VTQLLQLVSRSYEDHVLAARSTIRSDILCFSNEFPTTYMLTTIMFTVLRYGEQIQTLGLSLMSYVACMCSIYHFLCC